MACENCGTSVLVPPNRFQKFRFCSRKCGWHYKAKHERAECRCATCGKDFTVPLLRRSTARYCSTSCYYKAMSKKGGVTLTCTVCGSEYHRSPSHLRYKVQTCSLKCSGIARRAERPTSKDFPSVRNWMKRNGNIHRCARCGYAEVPDILVVHHKDRNRTHNDLSNLEVLCPNCHSLEHLRENLLGWTHKSTKRAKTHPKRHRLSRS